MMRLAIRMGNTPFKLILPLTIISFAAVTKYWYTLPVDAPDTMCWGFPFPYVCEGWHTSLSLKIFVVEFFADFLTYLLFWSVMYWGINRMGIKIVVNKVVTTVLWVFAGLVVSGSGIIAANPDNLFYLKRSFEMEVMETGFQFIWQQTPRPDYYRYHPESKNE